MAPPTYDIHGHDACVKALQAALRRGAGSEVELIQTHLSSVLLTPEFAYKLKKPVALPFVDFRSATAREHFCREELRLNRRFAPQLYLDVVPITGTPEAPALGGEGPVFDHAVRMRRFPRGALLSEQLAAGTLGAAHIDRLGAGLARLHSTAPADAGIDSARIAVDALDAVLRQLAALGCEVQPLQHWAATQAAQLHGTLDARRAAGAVRECHGDLHLANLVALSHGDGGEVVAFDCIEFDPTLRWIDTMSDLAFPLMDLKARGRAALAWRLLDVYLQHSGDHGGLPVLRFFEVYRALVRALVSRLSPPAGGTAPPTDYLATASQLACKGSGLTPRLAITCGYSGSGKSTLAASLLEAAGAVRLRSDVERKRLFGLGPLERSGAHAPALYSDDATRRTFDRLQVLAREALQAGYPVIVDAAFLQHRQREGFRQVAAALGVPFTILHCTAEAALLRERVAARLACGGDASEATPEVLAGQLSYGELPGAAEQPFTIAVDTSREVDVPALCARWIALD